MKKLFSFASLAIMALVSFGFSSCNEEEETPIPLEEKPYVSYKVAISDNFFKYAAMTITVDNDGEKTTYEMDESTQKDSIGMYYPEDGNKPIIVSGREVQIPVIENKNQPIEVTVSCKITEAGKAKIAEASEDDSEPIRYFLTAGDCTEKGTFAGTHIYFASGGEYGLKEFEERVNATIVYTCSVSFPLRLEVE